MELVHSELHRIARQRLRKERRDNTRSRPPAWLNEAYMKMFEHSGPQVTDRAHFMAVASRVMRNVLVDYARERGAQKRGGGSPRASLDPSLNVAIENVTDVVQLLDLDRAIEALASENPFPAQVIEMRYFGGMTAEETAAAVGRSLHVVQHELRFAHAWLRRRFSIS